MGGAIPKPGARGSQSRLDYRPERSGVDLLHVDADGFRKAGQSGLCPFRKSHPKTHRISSHLLLVLKRHPAGRENPQANAQVLGFIVELELAHPSSARLQPQPFPQLEYPWEDPEAGKILYPARDLPLAKLITDPQDRIASDLLKLASALANRFDEIFPE